GAPPLPIPREVVREVRTPDHAELPLSLVQRLPLLLQSVQLPASGPVRAPPVAALAAPAPGHRDRLSPQPPDLDPHRPQPVFQSVVLPDLLGLAAVAVPGGVQVGEPHTDV